MMCEVGFLPSPVLLGAWLLSGPPSFFLEEPLEARAVLIKFPEGQGSFPCVRGSWTSMANVNLLYIMQIALLESYKQKRGNINLIFFMLSIT